MKVVLFCGVSLIGVRRGQDPLPLSVETLGKTVQPSANVDQAAEPIFNLAAILSNVVTT